MKRYSNSTLPPARRRGGFTLIELMMVIAIIAVLIAVLLPAIGAVRSRMRITEVRNEISGLEQALADFKLKFNAFPPSSVTLYETQAGWNGDPRSRAIIRGLWPRFNFAKNRDLNNDGNNGGSYLLKGDQCLVFFLGGQWAPTGGFFGFSSNPTDPFISSGASSATRVGPFFDFDASRVLTVVPGAPYPAPLDMFPVYADPIPGQNVPYIYASSYDGTGYYTEDANGNNALDAGEDANGNGVLDSDWNTPASDPTGVQAFTLYLYPGGNPYKPKTYQIISPGFDNQYGVGGVYDPKSNKKVQSPQDRDNVTNFENGQLD